MAYENAKAYLKEYKNTVMLHERLCFRVQRLEASIGASGINYDGLPRGTKPSSPTEAAAIMLVDSKRKRDEVWDKVQKAEEKVEAVIESLEDEQQRVVLAYRYLEGMNWDEIACKMNYTERHMHRIHAEALCEVQMKLGGFDR